MLMQILDVIGTVAFSVSGAAVGIRKRMDVLGVAALGVITAVGGGIIRDVLIGQIPPAAFVDPTYALIAIAAALIVFLPMISSRINLDHFVWILTDSIGLGAFTMLGVSSGAPFDNVFLEIFLGVVTGVGGGVIRDVCAGDIPMIFVRHFYATPCIIGAAICAVLDTADPGLAVVSGFAVIVILRLLAAKFRWHLPKAK